MTGLLGTLKVPAWSSEPSQHIDYERGRLCTLASELCALASKSGTMEPARRSSVQMVRAELIDRLLCLLDVRLHALAVCHVSRGTRLRLPAMDAVLIHYVLSGDGVLTGSDGSTARLGPGTLIFVPQGLDHEIAERGDEPELVLWKQAASPLGDGMMNFATSGEWAEDPLVTACGTISANCDGMEIFDNLREPIAEDLSADISVRAAFELMIRELQKPRFGTKPLTEALMKQCLILAARRQVERSDASLLPLIGFHDPRLTRALLELMENPARNHSLDELADVSGMSRSLFAERFAQAFGRPPMDMLRHLRLHRAADLLRSTGLPVQVIAATVGYTSRSYFSRAFRAAYGSDPKAFRDAARQEQ